MRRWRLAVAAGLLLGVGVPLGMPVAALLGGTDGWRAWHEAERLRQLAGNTLGLVVGTLLVALPAGVAGAVLLYRSDLPLRRFLRFVMVLSLFVPLPLYASAWQATLGTGGWLPVAVWRTVPAGDPDFVPTGIAWKPWARGMIPAVWIHAAAALPWVVLIVGQGLCWVERELEEDALLVASPWRVLWAVTFPRCQAAVFAAGLWVAVQTATEITVTDLMQVRTFAEEVYTQFVSPDRDPSAGDVRAVTARAVAVSVPAIICSWALIVWIARRWERNLPPLRTLAVPGCLFRLGLARWPVSCAVLILLGLLAGLPMASLVWKAGLHGNPEAWSAPYAWHQGILVFKVHGPMVAESMMLAAVSGACAAGLALLSCWLAREARWFHTLILSLAALAWAMPGPVIGIGLKETIDILIGMEEKAVAVLGRSGTGPLQAALYAGPSLAPVFWVCLLRFFPFAVAVLWPVVRLLPSELRDAARVDGAGPAQEFCRLVAPLTAAAWVRAALAVAILSLGELSAGKLVETPGAPTFAHEVFNQMHYSVTNNVAALCLVLLAVVILGGSAWSGVGWLLRGKSRERET